MRTTMISIVLFSVLVYTTSVAKVDAVNTLQKLSSTTKEETTSESCSTGENKSSSFQQSQVQQNVANTTEVNAREDKVKVLIDTLIAEENEAEKIIKASLEKQQILRKMRQILIQSLEKNSSAIRHSNATELFEKFFQKNSQRQRRLSRTGDADSITNSLAYPFDSAIKSHVYHEDYILHKESHNISDTVAEIIILPLSIYNPFSRSVGSSSKLAPHSELVITISQKGQLLVFTPDGKEVGHLSLLQSSNRSNDDNLKGNSRALLSASFVFTQTVDKAVIATMSNNFIVELFQVNVWFNRALIIGGNQKPLFNSLHHSLNPEKYQQGQHSNEQRSHGSFAFLNQPNKSHRMLALEGYTVALSPLSTIQLPNYNIDPTSMILYNWRGKFRIVVATVDRSTIHIFNKTGFHLVSLDMQHLETTDWESRRSKDSEKSKNSIDDGVSTETINSTGCFENESNGCARIVRFQQLGSRITIAYGNTIYFYHMERNLVEQTRCVGLKSEIVDYSFDAQSPAIIYANTADGSTVVFDLKSKDKGTNPCVITRRLMTEVGSVESVPGYLLQLTGNTISVYNQSHDYQFYTSKVVRFSNEMSADVSVQATDKRQDDADSYDLINTRRSVLQVSPVGRGWARNNREGGSVGNLIVALSADRTQLHFFTSLLPFSHPMTNMNWLRYPMMGIAGLIVLVTLYSRLRGGGTTFAGVNDIPPNFNSRFLPAVGKHSHGNGVRSRR